MVGRRQAICHSDAEDLERRDTGNSRQWLRCNLTLPFPFRVNEDDFFGFVAVECQVVRPCPRLDVVDLGGPRVDVAGRNDKVGVVGELDELVSGGHRLQVASISHIRLTGGPSVVRRNNRTQVIKYIDICFLTCRFRIRCQ